MYVINIFNYTCKHKNLSTLSSDKRASQTGMHSKETTFYRTDITLQLLMFVTALKEGQIFIIFFLSIFFSCCPRNFKLGQTECAPIRKALTHLPISQLFLT